MPAKIVTMNRARRAAVATVVCGALALGSTGVASAATTAAGLPGAKHHGCARAPKALARIANADAALSHRLSILQADETKATGAGHTRLAARIERRITKLQAVETRANTLAAKINAKCPAGTSGTGSTPAA